MGHTLFIDLHNLRGICLYREEKVCVVFTLSSEHCVVFICPVSIRCTDDMRLEETNVLHSFGSFIFGKFSLTLYCIHTFHVYNGDNLQIELVFSWLLLVAL